MKFYVDKLCTIVGSTSRFRALWQWLRQTSNVSSLSPLSLQSRRWPWHLRLDPLSWPWPRWKSPLMWLSMCAPLSVVRAHLTWNLWEAKLGTLVISNWVLWCPPAEPHWCLLYVAIVHPNSFYNWGRLNLTCFPFLWVVCGHSTFARWYISYVQLYMILMMVPRCGVFVPPSIQAALHAYVIKAPGMHEINYILHNVHPPAIPSHHLGTAMLEACVLKGSVLNIYVYILFMMYTYIALVYIWI